MLDNKFKMRFAGEEDSSLIMYFIKELAKYENLLDQVVATEEVLNEWLFKQKTAEVIIGEYEGKPIGFMLFFYNFSTFLGKAGIYLEDLYIEPGMRGKGLGKFMLQYLAQLALERNCGRLEWWCLNWNEPSINFYKHLGAVPMDEWTVYRVSGEALNQLAAKAE
ncbi:GNAT family N-acetyltransferase [Cellulosilyticum sp. I15G10I2]|uniref:GNAT family N-acetyltransferase n=1 Tax=Cellulosilyticum sp. I15G10I2 TaxID=1892843 RepID=UPI000AC002B8|nr:GNAT family N-acetyltransferase [Cellulosilyticum sp. I15G10I2]